MTGRLRWEELEGRRILLYLPPGYPQEGKRRYPVFYASDGDAAESVAKEALEGLEAAVAKGEAAPFLWVCAAPLDREREYTPWPAPGLSKKGAAFAGQGNAYLAFLEGRLKPWVDRICRTQPAPAQTGLMGYSLGGLLAVYSLFTTETFGCVASLSGSLWYDGFAAFVQRTLPVNPAARAAIPAWRRWPRTRRRCRRRWKPPCLFRRNSPCRREAILPASPAGFATPFFGSGGYRKRAPLHEAGLPFYVLGRAVRFPTKRQAPPPHRDALGRRTG